MNPNSDYPRYQLYHLVTFTANSSSSSSISNSPSCSPSTNAQQQHESLAQQISRLRELEESVKSSSSSQDKNWRHKIWLTITNSHVKIYDDLSRELVEQFPLRIIHKPNTLDYSERYQNLVIFTVILAANASELHVFSAHCKLQAEKVVETILTRKRAIERPSAMSDLLKKELMLVVRDKKMKERKEKEINEEIKLRKEKKEEMKDQEEEHDKENHEQKKKDLMKNVADLCFNIVVEKKNARNKNNLPKIEETPSDLISKIPVKTGSSVGSINSSNKTSKSENQSVKEVVHVFNKIAIQRQNINVKHGSTDTSSSPIQFTDNFGSDNWFLAATNIVNKVGQHQNDHQLNNKRLDGILNQENSRPIEIRFQNMKPFSYF